MTYEDRTSMRTDARTLRDTNIFVVTRIIEDEVHITIEDSAGTPGEIMVAHKDGEIEII